MSVAPSMSVRTKWILSVGVVLFGLVMLVPRVFEPRDAGVGQSVPAAETSDAPAVHDEMPPPGGDLDGEAERAKPLLERPVPLPDRPTMMARPPELWNERDAPAPMLEGTDSAFANEPVDSLWSPRREGEILSAVAQMTESNLISAQVECRTSMCRVQLTQNVSLQPEEVAPTAMQMLTKLFASLDYGAPTPPVAMVRDGPSALTTVAYLRRDKAR